MSTLPHAIAKWSIRCDQAGFGFQCLPVLSSESASDVTLAAILPAVPRGGRETRQRCDLLAVERPEVGQVYEHNDHRDLSDQGNGDEEVEPRCKVRLTGQAVFQRGFDCVDLAIDLVKPLRGVSFGKRRAGSMLAGDCQDFLVWAGG